MSQQLKLSIAPSQKRLDNIYNYRRYIYTYPVIIPLIMDCNCRVWAEPKVEGLMLRMVDARTLQTLNP